MKPGKNEPNGDRRILTSSAASVVLGIAVAQLFEFDTHGRLHIASMTGQGLVVDTLLILSSVLIVVSVLGMTSSVPPGHLVVAGASLVAAAIIGRAILLHPSSGPLTDVKEQRTFLIFAGVVIIGACSLGSGLRRIVANRRGSLSASKNGEK